MEPKQRKDAGKTKKRVGTAEVAAKAYSIFLERQRNGVPGDHLSDWYEAERRLTRAGQPGA